MNYRDFIESTKKKYLNKFVFYEGKRYKVVDVDYNGMLHINKKAEHTDTTAVSILDVDVDETLKDYIAKFNKENYRHYHLKVNLKNEDIIKHLEMQDNKNAYIIGLIEKDLKKCKKMQ